MSAPLHCEPLVQASAHLPTNKSSPPAGSPLAATPGVRRGLGRGPPRRQVHGQVHRASDALGTGLLLAASADGQWRLWEGGTGKGASALLPCHRRPGLPQSAPMVSSRGLHVFQNGGTSPTRRRQETRGADRRRLVPPREAQSCRCRAQLGARARRQEVGGGGWRRGPQLFGRGQDRPQHLALCRLQLGARGVLHERPGGRRRSSADKASCSSWPWLSG